MNSGSPAGHCSEGNESGRILAITTGISEAILWMIGLVLVVVALTLTQEYYDGFEFIMTGSWLNGDHIVFFPKSPLLSSWLALIETAAQTFRIPAGLPLFHLAMLFANAAAIATTVFWIRRKIMKLSVPVITLLLVANQVTLHYAPFVMSEILGGGLIAGWLITRDRRLDRDSRRAGLPGVLLLALVALLRPQMVLLPLAVGFFDAVRTRRLASWILESVSAGFLYLVGAAAFFAVCLDCSLLEGIRQLSGFLTYYATRSHAWESHPWWAQLLHAGIMLSPAGVALLAWIIVRSGRDLVSRTSTWRSGVMRCVNSPDAALVGGGLAYLVLFRFIVTAADARYLLPAWPIVGWMLSRALGALFHRRPGVAALALATIVLFALPGLAGFRDAFYRAPLAQSLSTWIAAESRGGNIVLAMPTAALHPGGDKIFTRFDSSFTIHDWGGPAFAFHARRSILSLPPGATFNNRGFPIPDHLTRILAPGDLLVVPDPYIITTTNLPARMNPVTLVRWRPVGETQGLAPGAAIAVETAVWNPNVILEAARQGPGPVSSAIRHLVGGARPFFWALLTLAAAAGLGRIVAGFTGSGASIAEEILVGFLALGTWNLVIGSTVGLPPPLLFLPYAGILALRPGRWRESFLHAREALAPRHSMDSWLMRISVIGLLVALASAWAPPVGMDALTYHLALPDQYQLRGSTLPVATNAYHLYWQQAEMAFVPLVKLDPSGRAVGLLIFMLWIVGLAGLGALAHRLGGSARLALLLGATSPLIINLVAITKPDVICLSLVAWGARGLGDRKSSRRRIGMLLLGGAVAVKPNAAFLVLPLWLLTARRPGKEWLKESAALAALPLLWITRNLVHAGQALPGGYQVTVAETNIGGGGPLSSMLHFFSAAAVHYKDGVDGPFGFLFVVAMLVAALRIVRWEKDDPFETHFFEPRLFEARLAGAGLIGWLLWLWVGKGQARLLLPVLVAWIPSLALTWRELQPFGRRLLIALALVSLGSGLLIVEHEHAIFHYGIGVIDRARYFAPWLDSHALQERADILLPEDARVFAIGDAELFPLHRRAEYDGYWEPSRVLTWAHEAHDTALVLDRLRAQGFTHVLYNPGIMEQLIRRGLMPPSSCSRDPRILDEAIGSLPMIVEDSMTTAKIFSLTTSPPESPRASGE